MEKEYTVFDGKKTIRILSAVLKAYEEKVGLFTENTANYFIAVLELKEDMTEDELSETIMQAMNEDCMDSIQVKEILKHMIISENFVK